jgi:hypothetical protein
MKIIRTGKTAWPNRHETFTETIRDYLIVANESNLGAIEGYLDTTKGLQNLVREAIQLNTTIRTVGAGWSWTKIATAKDGIMIDTMQLNTLININETGVKPDYTGDFRKLRFAQCGNGIWELNDTLRTQNLSLKTCGASNGQTIVGAMATGAHGSTIDVGGVQDYIVGLHIIVGSDRHIYLERKSAPVVSDLLIQRLETELVQDDDLFNAALVSFGSFGIIHGVMMETEDLYLLETHMQRIPYRRPLKNAMQTLHIGGLNLPGGNERPFHFSVTINPYDLQHGAHVYSYYKRPYRNNYTRATHNSAGIGPGDDAACFIGKLTDAVPALVPALVNSFLANRLKPFSGKTGTLGEIFDNTDIRGKGLSTAMGVPLNVVNRVVEILLELNRTAGPFIGLFSFRFIKKSNATLAFTRFPDFTCIFEMDGPFSATATRFFAAVWKRLEDENIPFTFHWGKVTQLNPALLAKMYGANVGAWIAARKTLLDADCQKVFSNPLLKEWGLDVD